MQANQKIYIRLPLAIALLAAGLVVYLTSRPSPPASDLARKSPVAAIPVPGALEAALSATNTADRAKAIPALRQWLASLSKKDAAAAIRKILASGRDAPTGQSFKLNTDGSLREAPTLRTLLLDQLGKLDPVEAAAAAKDILREKTSPDEWAVALALYARAGTDAAASSFLKQKAEEMAAFPPWQMNPSVGFLEAFDVFVYTGDTAFVPTLAQFTTNKENPAVAHAAFLTLDRLAQNAPLDTLQTLNDNPALLQGREAMAAGLFARADVRDPGQKSLLSAYLLSPGRTGTELEAFAGLYPNENFMVSANLLTASPTLPNEELLARYQAAQQTIGQWLQDSQFMGIWPQLRQAQGRVSRVLNQPSR